MSTRRPAITLIEVLIAIFIMGIGMLAILVLFPLGALNMARALKDDRCTTIAANADALAMAFNLRNDTSIVNPSPPAPTPAFNFYLTPPTSAPSAYSLSDPNGPSYPVFVDPYYFNNSGQVLGTVGTLVPGSGFSVLPIRRVSPDYLNYLQPASPSWTPNPNIGLDTDRLFSLVDDLTFDSGGVPLNFSTLTGPLQRQGYYTYAYMLRRLVSQQASTTALSVVVYKGRSIQTPLTSAGSPQGEQTFSASGNRLSTTVALTWLPGQSAPDVRRGTWLLDTTYTPPNTAPTNSSFGYVNAKFYKVMEANMSTTIANTMNVEVYPPIQDVTGVSQVVVMENVVEVFDRGTTPWGR